MIVRQRKSKSKDKKNRTLVPSFKKIISTACKSAKKNMEETYLTQVHTDYNLLIIENLMCNGKCRVVSVFKDFLIWDDCSEFLRRFYNKRESGERLQKLFKYYDDTSVIFPNYTPLFEAKYIYKNIMKKQRVIDEQQDLEDKKNYELKHKKVHKKDLNKNVFGTSAYDEILDGSESVLRILFGIDNKSELKNKNIEQKYYKKCASNLINKISGNSSCEDDTNTNDNEEFIKKLKIDLNANLQKIIAMKNEEDNNEIKKLINHITNNESKAILEPAYERDKEKTLASTNRDNKNLHFTLNNSMKNKLKLAIPVSNFNSIVAEGHKNRNLAFKNFTNNNLKMLSNYTSITVRETLQKSNSSINNDKTKLISYSNSNEDLKKLKYLSPEIKPNSGKKVINLSNVSPVFKNCKMKNFNKSNINKNYGEETEPILKTKKKNSILDVQSLGSKILEKEKEKIKNFKNCKTNSNVNINFHPQTQANTTRTSSSNNAYKSTKKINNSSNNAQTISTTKNKHSPTSINNTTFKQNNTLTITNSNIDKMTNTCITKIEIPKFIKHTPKLFSADFKAISSQSPMNNTNTKMNLVNQINKSFFRNKNEPPKTTRHANVKQELLKLIGSQINQANSGGNSKTKIVGRNHHKNNILSSDLYKTFNNNYILTGSNSVLNSSKNKRKFVVKTKTVNSGNSSKGIQDYKRYKYTSNNFS